MYNDFRCTFCGKRFNFSAGTCGGCLSGMVIYDGAESKAAREAYEERQRAEQAAIKAAKERADREAAEQEKARKKAQKQARGGTPNTLTQPSWNTPVAVVAFIATGIFLASRDLDGWPILIGAVVAAALAGVFYRQVLAILGIVLVGWILINVATDDEPKRVPAPVPAPGPASSSGQATPSPAAPMQPSQPAQPPAPPILHKSAQPATTRGTTGEASIGIVDGDPAFGTPPGRCIDFAFDERMSCLLMGGDVAYLAGGGTLAYDGHLYIYHYKPLYPSEVSHLELYLYDEALIAVMRSGRPYYLGPSVAEPLQRTLLGYEVKEALILQLPYQAGIGLIESKADAIVRIEVPLRIYQGYTPAHYRSAGM